MSEIVNWHGENIGERLTKNHLLLLNKTLSIKVKKEISF